MKRTTDIIEEVITRRIRLEEIEAEIEEQEPGKNVKIIIETQTKEITIPTQVYPSEKTLKEIYDEITKEYRISITLEKRESEIRIILNEEEREWMEACLS